MLAMQCWGWINAAHLVVMPYKPNILEMSPWHYSLSHFRTFWVLSCSIPAQYLHHTVIPKKRYVKSLAMFMINAARHCIPCHWRSSTIPTKEEWYCRLNNIERNWRTHQYLTRKDIQIHTNSWQDNTCIFRERLLITSQHIHSIEIKSNKHPARIFPSRSLKWN